MKCDNTTCWGRDKDLNCPIDYHECRGYVPSQPPLEGKCGGCHNPLSNCICKVVYLKEEL